MNFTPAPRLSAGLVLCLCLCIAAPAVLADVSLPRLLANGMILQRDVPVRFWGQAEDGERVEVYLDGKRVGTARAEEGRWSVVIGSYPAGGPHRFAIVGDNMVTIEDAWFGDVWLASGQSNMELTMGRVATRYPDAIPDVPNPMIREFAVPKRAAFDGPLEDLDGGNWQEVTPDNVASFSAIGYYFARDLNARYGVPVGIIKNAYGGSAAESWLSEQALEAWPQHLETARRYQDDEYLAGLQAADAEASASWHAALAEADAGLTSDPPFSSGELDDSGWQRMSVPGYWADTAIGPSPGAVWFRKTVELPQSVAGKPGRITIGRIVNADVVWVNGEKVGETTYEWPPRIYEIPAGLLQPGTNTIAVRVVDGSGRGGLVPDKPYRLQVGDIDVSLEGEWRFRVGATSVPAPAAQFVPYNRPLGFYNAMLAPLANVRLKGVIWYQGESNVGRAAEYADLFQALIAEWRHLFRQRDLPFLFVQLANYLEPAHAPGESGWAELREAQRAALALPNTAMVVAIDVGEWNDIHPLDKETVAERLVRAARVVAYGETDVVASGPVPVALERKKDRLRIRFDSVGRGLVSRGDRLGGFAIAGADREFVVADAKIDGDVVVVSSDSVIDPVHVRYAWADNPPDANLYNEEGLPATPFQMSLDGER